MSSTKPYADIPGTTIFDTDQARLGYHLNMFCMSLMKPENRALLLLAHGPAVEVGALVRFEARGARP